MTAGQGRLDRRFLVHSRARGYAQVIGSIAVLFVLLAFASRANTIPQCLFLYVAIGCAQHKLFFPAHDCMHYSLFPTRAENRVCGIVLAALMGSSFDAMREQHLDHHRDFGKPIDPGASDYFVRFTSRLELLAFLCGPLVGSILLRKLPSYLLRAADTRGIPAPRSRAGGNALASAAITYGVIAAVQLALCALLTSGFTLHEMWRYACFYALPMVTLFLFFIRLRMFLEHGALDYTVSDYFEQKRPTTRTIYASRMEQFLLCGSHFNFHHEHHRYPGVPGWQLPSLHRELAPTLDAEDVRQTYAQALAEIWGNLPWRHRVSSRNPEVASSGW
jgi:fatty acid desaturase